jgi:hypothetical protein
MYRLPADCETVAGYRANIVGVLAKVPEDELSDVAAGLIVNPHSIHCQP